jgi:hypothetical protein
MKTWNSFPNAELRRTCSAQSSENKRTLIIAGDPLLLVIPACGFEALNGANGQCGELFSDEMVTLHFGNVPGRRRQLDGRRKMPQIHLYLAEYKTSGEERSDARKAAGGERRAPASARARPAV